MDQSIYLRLMQFPPEWLSWQMLPVEFLAAQASNYEPGHEDASEHDRHGVFQWWLRQQPEISVLIKLVNLSWLDPDQLMAGYVRQCIAQQSHQNADLNHALSNPYRRA
jgi:hypothetical protein